MNIDFQKYPDGLVPAIVQDSHTSKVLMLGFMNMEAFSLTAASGMVSFFSRSRQRLWTKGETSGNYLEVERIVSDCDSDALLIKARPTGPVCHSGSDTCFGETNEADTFLFGLQELIAKRKAEPIEGSYTSKLFGEGINKIAQKVGEEAVELIIEAKDNDNERFKAEAADLLYHLLVLFAEKDIELGEIIGVLKHRSRPN